MTMIDGRQAALTVRSYFEEVHGNWHVFGFQVDGESFDEKAKLWTVECSFFTSITGTSRARYKVLVDVQGQISKVDKIDETGAKRT